MMFLSEAKPRQGFEKTQVDPMSAFMGSKNHAQFWFFAPSLTRLHSIHNDRTDTTRTDTTHTAHTLPHA
jgi:hypothetical protein